MQLNRAPRDGTSSYVLADSSWTYLNDAEGIEYRFDTEQEARQELEAASLDSDLPVSEIVLLKETREEIPL